MFSPFEAFGAEGRNLCSGDLYCGGALVWPGRDAIADNGLGRMAEEIQSGTQMESPASTSITLWKTTYLFSPGI